MTEIRAVCNPTEQLGSLHPPKCPRVVFVYTVCLHPHERPPIHPYYLCKLWAFEHWYMRVLSWGVVADHEY